MPRLGGPLQCRRTWKRKTDSRARATAAGYEASCGTGRCSGQTKRKDSLDSITHTWERDVYYVGIQRALPASALVTSAVLLFSRLEACIACPGPTYNWNGAQ